MFLIRRTFFFKSVNNSQTLINVGTALSSRIGREPRTFLNLYVLHGSIATSLRGREKYYIDFVDNLLLFLTAKEF